VSAAHGRRWAQEVNFNRAFAVQSVGSLSYALPHTTSGPTDYPLLYRRTPGVQVLRLTVQFHPYNLYGGTSTTGTLQVLVGTTHAGVATATLAGQGEIGPFGGVQTFPLPSFAQRVADEWTCDVDVSALSTSSTYVVVLRFTPTTTGQRNGIARVSSLEVPLADTAPTADPLSTGEPGLNEAEADVRNRIYAGSATSVGGMARLVSEMDRARSAARRHLQVGFPMTTALAPWRNNTVNGALTWGAEINAIGSTWDPTFQMRARRLYAASTGNRYRFWALYRYAPTYSGLTGSFATVVASTLATGGATTQSATAPLANTAGAWALTSTTIDVPCDGTDQIAEITFSAATANTDGVTTTSDPVYLAALALIEEEA
jgi:hypothetical protein